MWAEGKEKESKKEQIKKMAKLVNEKNVYRDGGLGYCLPHRVSTSAIQAWLYMPLSAGLNLVWNNSFSPSLNSVGTMGQDLQKK